MSTLNLYAIKLLDKIAINFLETERVASSLKPHKFDSVLLIFTLNNNLILTLAGSGLGEGHNATY